MSVWIWVEAVALVAAIGALGFIVIEGWNPFDALYMAVITLTTVGYTEIHPLSTAGRVWAMVLAVAAIGIIWGSVGMVAQNMVADVASGKREARMIKRTIDSLSGHFVVCGYGRVGSLVARELTEDGQQVVVIDIRPDSLERAARDGFLIVAGDGTSDAVLKAAGVERARGLVSSIDSDANNVYVTLSARAMNPNLFIVGRAGAEGVDLKLRQAGADRAVSPYTMAGRRIAELALRPRVVEYIDAALSRGDLAFSMEEVEVGDGSELVGQTVGALRARGVFTLAIMRAPGVYEPNPNDTRTLVPGEHLIVSGSNDALREVAEQG